MRRLPGILLVCGLAGTSASAQWQSQASGTRSRLRALSTPSREVAWAAGSGSTWLRTTDRGRSWVPHVMTGGDSQDFRDLHAWDASTACLLAVGPGDKSRIYRTTDGGTTWQRRFTLKEPGFLDALAFWDRDHGLVFGDPVASRFQVFATDDGGWTWQGVAGPEVPRARPGEGGFASSGSCLTVQGQRNTWFGTGGGGTSRVFRSTDRGRTWTASPTPIRADNASSGIHALAFRDADHGVAVGGDYRAEADARDVAALTEDGGKSWRRPRGRSPSGYRSGLALLPGGDGRTVVAVGPNGADVSINGGDNWQPLGPPGFDVVSVGVDTGTGWAVEDGGRISAFDGLPPERP